MKAFFLISLLFLVVSEISAFPELQGWPQHPYDPTLVFGDRHFLPTCGYDRDCSEGEVCVNRICGYLNCYDGACLLKDKICRGENEELRCPKGHNAVCLCHCENGYVSIDGECVDELLAPGTK